MEYLLFRARTRGVCLAGLQFFGVAACEFSEPIHQESPVATDRLALAEDLAVETQYDDSASPVHVQVKSCTTTVARTAQSVDCPVDVEYALVGGGAKTISLGPGAHGAFLTESRPQDGRTWRGSSSDHMIAQSHQLTVFAIGMRLDGVNTQTLRDAIRKKSSQSSVGSAYSQIDASSILLGGGAKTQANPDQTYHRFLTASAPVGGLGWAAASRDHYQPATGTTEAISLFIANMVIEGFGALEVKHVSGPTQSASAGIISSTAQVEPGWAMIGMGASATTVAGDTGRMLTAIEPCVNGRCVNASSRDQIDASRGTTVAYVTQARKARGSHGLCNPGPALRSTTDACVAKICGVARQCCSGAWNSTCVEMVGSVCGRSCTGHTCTRTVFEPSKWNSPIVPSNCYYYALNRYPDGQPMHPGASVGYVFDSYGDFRQRLQTLAAADGLIPVAGDGTCSDNRTKIMIGANGGQSTGWHAYRQDADGQWSDKYGEQGEAKVTLNNGQSPYVPANQVSSVEYFFCACDTPLPQ